jgi:hypothetical protein
MSDKKIGVKYASQLSLEDYIYVPGHRFPVDRDKILSPANRCMLIFLDEDQINIILEFIQLAKRYRLWGFPHQRTWSSSDHEVWDIIEARINGLEACLMGGCDTEKIANAIIYLADRLGPIGRSRGGCACGCGSASPCGNGISSGPGTEGGDIPQTVGFELELIPDEPGSIPYNNRKCAVANLHVDTMLAVLAKLDSFDVDGLAVFGVSFMATFLTAALATILVSLPAALLLGLVGGLAAFLVANSVEFNDIVNLINDNREDLICALYSSGSSGQARDQFMTVIEDLEVLTSVEEAFLRYALLPDHMLNALYFTNPEIEASLDGYSPITNCANCGDCDFFVVTFGSLVSFDGNSLTVSSQHVSSPTAFERMEIVFNYDVDAGPAHCGPKVLITLDSLSPGFDPFQDCGHATVKPIAIYPSAFDSTRTYTGCNANEKPVNHCGGRIQINSENGATFSATITYGIDCE